MSRVAPKEGQEGPCWPFHGSCGSFMAQLYPRQLCAEGSCELCNSLDTLERGPGINRRKHKIPGILLTAGNGNGEPKPCSACSQLSWHSPPPFPTLHPCQESFGICFQNRLEGWSTPILKNKRWIFARGFPTLPHNGNSSFPPSWCWHKPGIVRCPCPWNKRSSKVPSSPNHSGILTL